MRRRTVSAAALDATPADPTPNPATPPNEGETNAFPPPPFLPARLDAAQRTIFVPLPQPLHSLPAIEVEFPISDHPELPQRDAADLGLTQPESYAQWMARCRVRVARNRYRQRTALVGIYHIDSNAHALFAFPYWYGDLFPGSLTAQQYLISLVRYANVGSCLNESVWVAANADERHLAQRVFALHRHLLFTCGLPRRTLDRLASLT